MKRNRLNYYFDREADILYFSRGERKRDDVSQEIGDDILVRKDSVTGEIVGFTILNFLKRGARGLAGISVPLEADFRIAR